MIHPPLFVVPPCRFSLCPVILLLLWALSSGALGSDPAIGAESDADLFSFDSRQMVEFNRQFKCFISSVKKCPDQQAAAAYGSRAGRLWEAVKAGALELDSRSAADADAISALLDLALARARQGEMAEALETTVRVRTELYLLHERLGLLGPEDHMIYFHNGILHRIEPMVEEARYLELALMIPDMKEAASRFVSPPPYADKQLYSSRYQSFEMALDEFISQTRHACRYVDPEGGAIKLKLHMKDAFHKLHAAFGALYLGFPTGVPTPSQFCRD